MELCFISATLQDGAKGLSGELNRAKLFDFLSRMAQQYVREETQSSKEPVGQHLPKFID